MIKHLIKGGYLVDPSQGLVGNYDVLIEGGRIKKVGKDLFEPEAEVVDASGLVVSPGFVDVHVHFRDPGQTYKEDIRSGSETAVAGGFTTVVCMPNTDPPIDSPDVVRYVLSKSEEVGLCNVLPAGAITEGRKGNELSDLWSLKRSGCVAFTDDGTPVMNPVLMRKVLEFSSQLGVPVLDHCEDGNLAKGAVNEGEISSLLGISARSSEAEDILIARDCILAYHTGGHVHIQHLSTSLGVDIVRYFKDKGAKVTCEVTPHHLFFTEGELLKGGANAKVNPPLRKDDDVRVLRDALSDGTVDCVATDHAPHAPHEKGRIDTSLPGMIGLQTALPLMLNLVSEGLISMSRMVELMSVNPARMLGLESGTLREGSPADVVIFDPKKEWVLNEETSRSKSKNTPLWNRTLRGKVVYTIRGGKVVYRDG